MRLNFNKVFTALVILTLFVGLSCASAAVADTNASIHNDFTMAAKYNAGTGYHWEVSPDSYGVKLIGQKNVIDHPGTCGSSGTAYFHFVKTGDEGLAKIVLISPTGEIVDSMTKLV